MLREEIDDQQGPIITQEVKKYDEAYDLPMEKDDLDGNLIFTEAENEGHPVSHQQIQKSDFRALNQEININSLIDPEKGSFFITDGHDHYKKLFTFTQRKIESENFRFKYPNLIPVVIESINSKVFDNQKIIGKFFYRFHLSSDLTIGELAQFLIQKVNSLIPFQELKLKNERVRIFLDKYSVPYSSEIKRIYEDNKDLDGWVYFGFIFEDS